MKGVANVAGKAHPKAQREQHCWSWSDCGACRSHSRAADSIFILAQQLVFSACWTGTWAGTAAKAIEEAIVRQTKNRRARRMAKQS